MFLPVSAWCTCFSLPVEHGRTEQVPRTSWIPLRAIACQQHGGLQVAFHAYGISDAKTLTQPLQ